LRYKIEYYARNLAFLEEKGEVFVDVKFDWYLLNFYFVY